MFFTLLIQSCSCVEFKQHKEVLTMFSSLEAVPRSPEMSGWGCCVKYKCREPFYSAASLSNRPACCGNWRSWRSKHHLLWWKMRSRKKKINWYAPLLRSEEQLLLLRKWVTTNNEQSGCEIWPITVCPLLRFHTLDLRHVSCYSAVNRYGLQLAQGHLNRLVLPVVESNSQSISYPTKICCAQENMLF